MDEGEVREAVVCPVSVDVVDVPAVWDGSVGCGPDESVEALPFVLEVEAAEVIAASVELLDCVADDGGGHPLSVPESIIR